MDATWGGATDHGTNVVRWSRALREPRAHIADGQPEMRDLVLTIARFTGEPVNGYSPSNERGS